MAAATTLDFQNLNLTVKRVNRVDVHYGAKFCDERSNDLWNMVIFRFFKMAAGAILDWIFKIWFFNSRQVKRVNVHHHAKFRDDRSNVSEIWRVFIFPRWRPSAILSLWCTRLDHPRRVLGGLYRCAKFGWNRRWSFEDIWVSILYQFGLKMPIHGPFGGFGIKIGVMENFLQFYPSRNAITWDWRLMNQTA